MTRGHWEYKTPAALWLATMTGADFTDIDSGILNTRHEQTWEMPEEMPTLSVDTCNWAAGFGTGNYTEYPPLQASATEEELSEAT